MTTILEAAYSKTVYAAALKYLELGFSVLPCHVDKSPAIQAWKRLQVAGANKPMIEAWSRAGLLSSVGVICGQVSGNLVVVDCDGHAAVSAFVKRFPELTDTYTVVSGSRKGAHFYLYADTCPPTTRVTGADFGNIEMRSNGAYVIAPPSLHPSGNQYRVSYPEPILRVSDLYDLKKWIESLIREKHGGIMPPPTGKVWNADKYARGALKDECERVALTSVGRNNALNVAAFRMARFVRDGRISRDEVETALEYAASHLAADDGIMSVKRTIKSGLDAGIVRYAV